MAPSVIISIDSSIDTSLLSEIEEEESGKSKDILSVFSLENNDFNTDLILANCMSHRYRLNKYINPFQNIISPPPDYTL